MFTGIVEETGSVVAAERGGGKRRLTIKGEKIFSDLQLGDSVAVNGVCLTVSRLEKDRFTADVMNETAEKSSLGELVPGSRVNMERAMAVAGRLGGHIVSGHIDGTGTIKEFKKDDDAVWITVETEGRILKYIVAKGSIAIDGVSLTVAALGEKEFSVSLIPHTAENTILLSKKKGEKVNLENDIIGKYVERLMTFENSEDKESTITRSFLIENGF